MAEWQHFSTLCDCFGVSRGRLICEFPGQWRKLLFSRVREHEQSGRLTSGQANRIINAFGLEGILRRALVPSSRHFGESASWHVAAATAQPPFDLVVSAVRNGCANELVAGEFLPIDPSFRVARHAEIPRVADRLIDCGWSCYRRAKTLILVDRYFMPTEAKFGRVLGKLIARLAAIGKKPLRLEVHVALPRDYHASVQQNNWLRWAQRWLPPGWPIRVAHWDRLETGSKLHARYILTDIGGLDYNWGMDEAPSEHTQVSLLDDDLWELLYRRFAWQPENTPKDFSEHPERILTVQR